MAELPGIALGPHRISRLVLGANPINGGSHLSRFVNEQMRRYFTPARILSLLRACEAEGVDTWQSGPGNLDLYARHRDSGGGMRYLSLYSPKEDDPGLLRRIAALAIGVAYHGEVTDVLFRENRLDTIRDELARMRDAGTLVGISTHIPEVVEYVESRGWDIDYYMTCVYQRNRTPEQIRALLGHIPLPERELYLEEDPPLMWRMMRLTPKPCLAFKILAAGRLCERPQQVEEAFKQTLENIKPIDGIILGMYPEYEDQVALNAGYVRRLGRLGQRRE